MTDAREPRLCDIRDGGCTTPGHLAEFRVRLTWIHKDGSGVQSVEREFCRPCRDTKRAEFDETRDRFQVIERIRQ